MMNSIIEATNWKYFKQNHLLLLLTIIATIIFVMAGSMKVSGNPMMAMMFENRYGLPLWFMFFIGYAEIFGALSLWFRKWSLYGALGLLVIIAGASAYHWSLGDSLAMGGPAWGLTVVMLLITLYQWRAHAQA